MHLKRIKRLNQFIPFDFIPDNYRIVNRKIKVLDCDYLADLFHSFYIGYLRSKSGENIVVELASVIMRRKYGTYYNYYVDFLINKGFISLHKNYIVGERCKSYKLNISKIQNTYIVPYINSNTKLIWFYNSEEYKDLQLRRSVYSKKLSKYIVNNLSHISIEYKQSINYLNSIPSIDKFDRKYIKNLNSLDNINDGNIYVTFDQYGRVHTNFTVLKKKIRTDHLSIDGEKTYERDIISSQAMFLLYFILLQDNTGIDKIEIRDFQSDIVSGIFYDNFVSDNISRDDIKVKFFKYIFGINYQQFAEFKSRYPSIFKFIFNYKSKDRINYEYNDRHKIVAHNLQKMEGDFVFNTICKQLMDRNIIFYTVHDSIVVKQSDSKVLDEVFDQEIKLLKMAINDTVRKKY